MLTSSLPVAAAKEDPTKEVADIKAALQEFNATPD
jgi:hypothetical protein